MRRLGAGVLLGAFAVSSGCTSRECEIYLLPAIRVVDADEAPVCGAHVVVTNVDESYEPTAQGVGDCLNLFEVRIVEGAHSYAVTHPDFASATGSFALSPSDCPAFEIEPKQEDPYEILVVLSPN